jgi:hypothetical protein
MNTQRFDIRTSSRRVFRRCLRKWGFSSSMRMNLRRKGSEQNINFWFGSAIHFSMEDYFGYNKFGDPRRAFKAYYNAFKPEERPEGAEEHYELGLAMLSYFLEWYPKHNADMQFQTLWLTENDMPVPPGTAGARPAVEEEFTLDLGLKVLAHAITGKFIKEWEPKVDKLFGQIDCIQSIDQPSLSEEVIRANDKDTVYQLMVIKTQEQGSDLYIQDLGNQYTTFETIPVKVVPVCYHGTMDRIVVDKYGRWWVLDYKTAKGADTRKLETDDQISAYMWAAEQRYQHPFYGFIYLQLTKDVAKPPKRLKDGTLSVDKKQKTTYYLFKNEVIKDYGSVQKAPNKIIEMLNYLADLETPEGDRFIRWDFILRNDNQKLATYINIMAEAKMMINKDLFLFPNPTRDCGWDCPFREICIAMDQGRQDDVISMIDADFEVRPDTLEHNDDNWRSRIAWPETPMEAAAIDDVDLRPSNIFNIELPEKYYDDNYYDE